MIRLTLTIVVVFLLLGWMIRKDGMGVSDTMAGVLLIVLCILAIWGVVAPIEL